MTNERQKVGIIGGGPAGLIAAQRLRETTDCDVHVYEQKPSVGRKFLIAGRGGLNLTHSENITDFLKKYGDEEEFLTPFINAFTPDDLREWAHKLGIETFVGSSGRVFPSQMKSTALMRAWTKHLTEMGVHFHLHHSFVGFDEAGSPVIENKDGDLAPINADAVLFTTGGASYPHLGATGEWAEALNSRHIETTPFQAINCGFNVSWSHYLSDKFAGQPLKNIEISLDDETSHGDLIVTNYGLEGGTIYSISRAINVALATNNAATIYLDLKPNLSMDQIALKLSQSRKKQSLSNFLRKQLKLTALEIGLIHELCDKRDVQDVKLLANKIKALPIEIQSARPIDRAISTMGGIKTSEFDEHLMLKKQPGWFAAGEMIDWDAPTGGYLLQACFSTGVAAANGITRWLHR
ncbi:MAG: TIGR03862 family flavoprotein [Sneathiella sp.]